MPNRYRLKGASLEEIRTKAEAQYGPAARIVSAERVISPGIAGMFAANRFEAVIELQPRHDVVTGEVIPDADVLSGDGDVPGPASPRATPRDTTQAAPAEETSRKNRRKAGKAGGKAAKDTAKDSPKPAQGTATGPGAVPGHALQGDAIAALLAEADAAELTMHRPDQPALSTEMPGFAELLDQLGSGLRPPVAPQQPPATTPGGAASRAGTPAGGRPPAVRLLGPVAAPAEAGAPEAEKPAPPRPAAPAPLNGTGDLVVLVGLEDDPLDTALAMSIAAGGADVRTAGELSAYGHLHLDGRQSATAARAHAVETEQTVLAAFGLGKGRHALARLQAIAALSPDQVWVVVDAGRKAADTARWVSLVRARLEVDAVALVGAADTSSPETIDALHLPVGWIDGRPASQPVPWAAADGREG